MAEAAEMMERLLLFAAEVAANVGPIKQVTPLSPNVKAIGSLLGVLVAAVGVWLALSHRAQSGKPAAEQGLGAKLRWRTPIALLLAVSGILVEIGVWTDPTTAPGMFVIVWLLAMALLTVTIVAAGLDWWWVTRLATREKQALIRGDRDRLLEELSRRKRPSTPPPNGQSQ
jgi:uncharacterized membrane protein